MTKKMTMTNKILVWMAAGLVVGSLINAIAADNAFIQDYLVNGLFHVAGAVFINMLKMLVVPLVTFSLICGVCGLGDVSKLGRVGLKAFLLFLMTTALAISLAVGLASVVGPGEGFELNQDTSTFSAPEAPALTQVFIDLVPSNPVNAFAEGNMLQIIFFVILFGICMLMIGERARPIIDLSERLNEVMMQVVTVVMHVAPYGVFALMAKTFAQQGLGLILPMISYFGVVAAGEKHAVVFLQNGEESLQIFLIFIGVFDLHLAQEVNTHDCHHSVSVDVEDQFSIKCIVK